MTQDQRLDIYRAAFESANTELNDILAEFEKLSIRKEQVEKLVMVLKPLFEADAPAAAVDAAIDNPETITDERAADAPKLPSGEMVERGADPFQRRIDHVLGIGAGIRDVRKYSRQF
jgi:hypothetical protein